MHPLFHISKENIQSLDDSQARELIALLCKAELSSKNLDTNSITFGGNQRAADGGIDVRVEAEKEITGYIPRSYTVFQVKAEIFTPRQIEPEMAPKGNLRPAIIELADHHGAYIIASTKDDVSDKSLKARRKAMTDCLASHQLKNVDIDFYDSQRLANWSEKHPSIVLWIKSLSQAPINGWRPYEPWAYGESSIDSEYLIDNKVKVFVPQLDDAISILEAIDRLRSDLNVAKSSTRIVGLSGVGKTRLLQALFDDRIETKNKVLAKEKVIYTDISYNPTIQPSEMLEALCLSKTECIVIVDNCGLVEHRKLTEIVKKPDSQIRFVTVEYDIRDDLPDDTTCYRLESSSDEVIASLLKRNYQQLSDLDINKIVEFSDGNARVAYALASTSESKGQIARLRDEDLFTRLFVQSHIKNDELQKCAEVASLLYSFDSEDISETSELAILSSLAEVSIQTFLRNIVELQRRGLVQERGKWKAILPHAISNRLASRALETYPVHVVTDKLFSDISLRLTRSFSHRLSFMHESVNAKKIVSNALASQGLLKDLSKIDERIIRIVKNIAPINQRAILDALISTFDNNPAEAIENEIQSDFLRLLRQLAYEVDLFDDAVKALINMALRDGQSRSSHESNEILQSLFSVELSGTMALPKQRLNIITRLLCSNAEPEIELGLSLLRSSLENGNFSSHYEFDFGALKRTYGWRPQTYQDDLDWFIPLIELAVQIGMQRTPVGGKSRALLGMKIRSLWGDPNINALLDQSADQLLSVDGWPDGWLGVRMALNFDKDYHKEKNTLEALIDLEQKLAPRDLITKIQAKVLSRGHYGADLEYEPDDDSGSTQGNPDAIAMHYKAQSEAEDLGRDAASNTQVLENLDIFFMNSNYVDKLYFFGKGLASHHASVTSLLNLIKVKVQSLETERSGINLSFVAGIIAGWHETNPRETSIFLDEAVSDEVWGRYYPYLQSQIQLKQQDFDRLLKSLDVGIASSQQYSFLAYGRKSDDLTAKQTAALLEKLEQKSDDGVIVVLDILYMLVHCAKERDDEYNKELREYSVKLISDLDWNNIDISNSNFIPHLANIFCYTITKDLPEAIVSHILANLLSQESDNSYPKPLGELISPFIETFPQLSLDYLFSQADRFNIYRLLKTNHRRSSAMEKIDSDALIDWCSKSLTDRCEFVSSLCKLFIRTDHYGLDDTVHGIADSAQKLLKIAPNKSQILEIFMSRYSPNSWSGSRSVIMRSRLAIIDQLNPDNDIELKRLIDKSRNDFELAIAREVERERNMERLDTGRFES